MSRNKKSRVDSQSSRVNERLTHFFRSLNMGMNNSSEMPSPNRGSWRRSRSIFFFRKRAPRRFPGFEGENCSPRNRSGGKKRKKIKNISLSSHAQLMGGAPRKLINGQEERVHFHSRLSPVSNLTSSFCPTSEVNYFQSRLEWAMWSNADSCISRASISKT